MATIIASAEELHRVHLENQERLPMWLIMRPTTSDYPGWWVIHMRFTLPVDQPTNIVLIHRTLEEARANLPPGLFNIGRYAQDDPVIEEVWM